MNEFTLFTINGLLRYVQCDKEKGREKLRKKDSRKEMHIANCTGASFQPPAEGKPNKDAWLWCRFTFQLNISAAFFLLFFSRQAVTAGDRTCDIWHLSEWIYLVAHGRHLRVIPSREQMAVCEKQKKTEKK